MKSYNLEKMYIFSFDKIFLLVQKYVYYYKFVINTKRVNIFFLSFKYMFSRYMFSRNA